LREEAIIIGLFDRAESGGGQTFQFNKNEKSWQFQVFFISPNMPTLLIKNGFKFFFFANEHEPKHIHVVKGGDFAKIELGSLKVVKNFLKLSDLKKALAITREYSSEFERKWDEYFKR
jgi:hypothetical protein